MSVTNLADVQNQMQTKWSKLFVKELRATRPLVELVSKDYQGEIVDQHSTVKVSMLRALTGETRSTTNGEADSFNTEKLVLDSVSVTANKRFVAATEITDLAELQSQLGDPNMKSAIREALLDGISNQVNIFLRSLIAPSASAPDHIIGSKANLAAADLVAARVAAGKAKWRKDKPWYALLDPTYMGDLLGSTTLTSGDFVSDKAVESGEIARRYGFNIMEDNSFVSASKALFFHPDFLIYVIQKQAKFEISSLHSQKKFGYLISVDLFGGGQLNIQGALQHYYVTAASVSTAAGAGVDANA